jgi:hypothetical protein
MDLAPNISIQPFVLNLISLLVGIYIISFAGLFKAYVKHLIIIMAAKNTSLDGLKYTKVTTQPIVIGNDTIQNVKPHFFIMKLVPTKEIPIVAKLQPIPNFAINIANVSGVV